MLCAETDAVGDVPPDRWSAAFHGKGQFRTYSRWGGFLDDIRSFDASFFGLGQAEAEQMDPQQRLLLESAWNALEDAGMPLDRSEPSPFGVFVGASTHDYSDIQFDTQELCAAGAFSATGAAQSIISNRISYCLNLCGPSFTVDTACSSSLVALHLAAQSLRSGECSTALLGGVNCLITPSNFIAFSSLSALSHDGRCKSFDASGDGFVRAEGVGVVVLKRLSDAIAAGDRIYASVLASGLNQDGRTPSITMPNGAAQEQLVRSTWRSAGINPADVCYVEAHGTGTAVGDPAECQALGAVAAEGRAADTPCLLGSVKSNIGHLESGAGVIGLMKLALVLFHREAPPSLHFNTPNPEIDFDGLKLRVVTRREPLPVLLREADGTPRYLGAVNSFGFGGANAHALLSSAPGQVEENPQASQDTGSRPSLLLLSAASEEALIELAGRYRALLTTGRFNDAAALRKLTQAAANRRAHLPQRLALVGSDRAALINGLSAYEKDEPTGLVHTGKADDAPGPGVVFVYSGQGPQWWAMGRELWEREPGFRQVIEACDEHLRDLADWSLVSELLRDETSSRLGETAIAQPAIFALQVGVTQLLRDWGLSPAATVGHSVGEAAAAWAAGALTLRQGIRLMFHRGRSMAVAHGRGTLLALGIAEEEALAEVAPYPESLSLAAVNAPSSVTLAGERERLQEIFERYESDGVFARFVPVEYPFHSPFMDPAKADLLESLADLRPAKPRIPLYSTVTGGPINEASVNADYWWRNVREPVRFAPAIIAMVRGGFRQFLEISAHPALIHSIRECMEAEGVSGLTLPTLRRDGEDQTNMVGAMAQLHCHGVSLDWAAYLGGRGRADAGLPRYPWQRKEYWRQSPQALDFYRYQRPHPFLWRQLPNPEPTWEMVLDSAHHAYFKHHSVAGRAIFPGAGYLEGALAIAEQIQPASPTRTLEEVRFEAMLPIGAGDHAARLHLQSLDHGARFSIFSRSAVPAEANWMRHAAGRIRPGGRLPDSVDVGQLPEGFTGSIAPDAIYQALKTAGLDYGPAFRVIQEAWGRNGEALCWLRLPAEARIEGEQYHFHPALLDGCLQALFVALLSALDSEAEGQEAALEAYVPVAVERMVTTAGAVGDRLWTRVRVKERSPDRIRCDIESFAPDGTGVMRMQGCLLQGLQKKSAKGAGASLSGAWYRAEWEGVALESESIEPPSATPLTLATTFAEYNPAGDGFAAKEQPARLESDLASLLKAQLQRHAGMQSLLAQLPGGAGKAVSWGALIRGYPQWFAEIDLWRRLTHLPDALRGEVAALDALIGGGAGSILEHYDASSWSWEAQNRALAKMVGDLLGGFPEGRRLKLLELGARTGAVAAELLRRQALPAEVGYCCCDHSSAVTALAKDRFTGHPNVLCTAWGDLSDARHDLMVVRAPELLTPEVLERLSGLLVEGGYLLVSRRPKRPRIFGLLEAVLNGAIATESMEGEKGGLDSRLQQQGFVLEHLTHADAEWTLARAPMAPRRPAETFGRAQDGGQVWWLLHDNDHPTASLIRHELMRRGDAAISIPPDEFQPSPDLSGRLKEAAGVLFLGADRTGREEMASATEAESQCQKWLSLLQTLGDPERVGDPPPLILVTQGAFAAGRDASGGDPAQAALAGMARVAMSELAKPFCRVVDLSLRPDEAEVRQLALQLDADDREEQVALRHEARYVQRVAHCLQALPSAALLSDDPVYCGRLRSARAGSLDQLQIFREKRRTLGEDEVEIDVRAAGLNFRDVMKALGIYPTDVGDENLLGDECAGIVRGVGPEVTGLSPGDAVIAIAPACFGNTAVTRARLVVPLPKGWSFAEGATVLIVYLTAYHALFRLARLRAGERVLIHAGAGGVGLAAIHLAQQAGAEVFATAGSDAKRTLLRDLGVKHVFSSRTLDFADEIRACLDGEGVDIVLNSLAGEAIHQGLALLRPYGRFLEIGKRDIYEHGHLDLSPFRNALSYFAIDLARMMASGEAGEILEEMRDLFARGDVRPLPYRAFPLTHAVEAFRYMAEARHVGKIVLTLPSDRPLSVKIPAEQNEFRCRSDRAYIVSGGLRGFGLATAEWLAQRGAGHLFLLSRSGQADAEGESAIQRMQRLGVQVTALATDVGSAPDLDKALHLARRSAPIGGIIHAAAVYQDEMLPQCSSEGLHNVFRAKAEGGWNLHQRTLQDPVEFFVLYSSISAMIGNPGQASYVAANAFLEGLAEARVAQQLPALAVGWDRIADTGYVARNQRLGEYMDRMGFGGLDTAEALEALGQALGRGRQGSLVLTRTAWGEWLKKTRFLANSTRFDRLRSTEDEPFGEAESESAWLAKLLDIEDAQRHGYLLTQLRGLLSRMLAVSVDSLDPNKPLDELGIDSLSLVELISTLETNLGVNLPGGLLADSGGAPMTLDALVTTLLGLLQGDAETGADVLESSGPLFDQSSETHLAQLLEDSKLPQDVVFPRLTPTPQSPETPILLTGATGFLGCYLLTELLQRTEAPVYALVRCDSEAAGLRRIVDNLDHYGLRLSDQQISRIRILPGDIRQQRLGLAPDVYEHISRNLGAIYHNAAAINHLLPYAQLRAINVEGLIQVLRLAAAGAPKILHYTSTVAVFAPEAGSLEARTITEGVLPDSPDALLGGYSETKWVGEKLVLDARERGLQTAIYRPGLVIGDERTGISSQHDLLWRIVQSSIETGVGPGSNFLMPLARVDFVAAAMAELSLLPASAGQIFHLVDAQETTLRQIIEQALTLGYQVRFESLDQWTREMESWREHNQTAPILPYLKLFPSGIRENIISGTGLRFATDKSQQHLSPETLARSPTMPKALLRNLEHLLGTPAAGKG
jgi:thioester reductase-like protein